MKRLTLCGFTLFSMIVGCSSDNGGDSGGAAAGPSAQASAARARFAGGPSAPLTTSNGARALSETKRQQTSGSSALKANPLGGGGGSTTGASLAIRGLHALDGDAGATSPASTCADIQAEKDKGTCACPGGGDLAYDVPNLKALKSAAGALPDELDIAFAYHACVLESTTYDGALEIVMSKKSVVNAGSPPSSAPPGPAAAGGMNMLIVATNLTVGGDKLDFAFAMDGGVFYYAPSVDANGGYVLSELSLTGGTKIHAKNGTFDCTTDDTGTGSCESESGGDAIPIGPSADGG